MRIGPRLLSLTLIVAGLAQGKASWGQPVRYAAMMSRLHAAAATGRVRVIGIGKSVEGRAIPMVAFGSDAPRTRVLVICRQHGDEPASTEAAMSLVHRTAQGDTRLKQALQKVQLLLVPMANPDGAERHQRLNARGVDLNRDWQRRTQPEVQALARVFRQYTPQVVLDEHEWTPDDLFHSNSLEMARSTNGAASPIHDAVLRAVEGSSIPLRKTYALPQMDDRLAHRYFGSQGAAAYLLETSPDVDPAARLNLYQQLMVQTAKNAVLYVHPRSSVALVGGAKPLFPVRKRAHLPIRKQCPFPYETLGFALFTLFLASMYGKARHEREEVRERNGEESGPELLRNRCDLAARLEGRRLLAQKAKSAREGRPERVPPIRRDYVGVASGSRLRPAPSRLPIRETVGATAASERGRGLRPEPAGVERPDRSGAREGRRPSLVRSNQ